MFFYHKLATSTLNTDRTDTNGVKLLLKNCLDKHYFICLGKCCNVVFLWTSGKVLLTMKFNLTFHQHGEMMTGCLFDFCWTYPLRGGTDGAPLSPLGFIYDNLCDIRVVIFCRHKLWIEGGTGGMCGVWVMHFNRVEVLTQALVTLWAKRYINPNLICDHIH